MHWSLYILIGGIINAVVNWGYKAMNGKVDMFLVSAVVYFTGALGFFIIAAIKGNYPQQLIAHGNYILPVLMGLGCVFSMFFFLNAIVIYIDISTQGSRIKEYEGIPDGNKDKSNKLCETQWVSNRRAGKVRSGKGYGLPLASVGVGREIGAEKELGKVEEDKPRKVKSESKNRQGRDIAGDCAGVWGNGDRDFSRAQHA